MRFIPKPWFSGEYDQVEAVILIREAVKFILIFGANGPTRFTLMNMTRTGEAVSFQKRKPAAGSGDASGSSSSSTHTGEPYTSLVEDHARKGPTLFNPELMPKVPCSVKPISKQGELESRRVWHPVTKALQKADYDAANAAKNKD